MIRNAYVLELESNPSFIHMLVWFTVLKTDDFILKTIH